MADTSSELLELLNSTQSRAAHNSVGISLQSFLSSLVFSVTYFLLQVLIFVVLRRKFRSFYDPFTTTASTSWRDRYNWIKQLSSIEIESFRTGTTLEEYFFLRFLYLQLFLFLTIACVSIPVLIPINYFCGQTLTSIYEFESDGHQAEGLDHLSTANISPEHIDKYLFHFILTVLIVLWYHYLLKSEIEYSIEEKNKELLKIATDPKKSHIVTTVFLDNVPPNFKTLGDVKKFLPKAAKVWNVYPFGDLDALVKHYKNTRDALEDLEVKRMKRRLGDKSIPKHIRMHKPYIFPGATLTLPGLSERVCSYDYLVATLKETASKIQSLQDQIKAKEERLGDDLPCTGKVFVQFRHPKDSYQTYQTLLAENSQQLCCRLIQTDPTDIIWGNLLQTQESVSNRLKEVSVFIVYILVILAWVLPVAMVGSISQLPYLTALIPTIRWINRLPGFARGFLAGILPTIVLAFLTGFALEIFHRLSLRENNPLSGARMQCRLQQWIFIFLFFHLFIVITISSGLIVVLESLIYRPLSVPSIVARDLPKASNFFFSFFVYRALTLFGNSLLQFYRFFTEFVIYPWVYDTTPRQKKLRKDSYKGFYCHWGDTYPTFSVYSSIALVYSVISPLVLLFTCINFLLDLFTYKYLLTYLIDSSKRRSCETYGFLYPMAWRQVYAGIYSLEVFLTGLLFLARDQYGNKACVALGMMMLVVICITVWEHVRVNRRYENGIKMLPAEMLQRIPATSSEVSRWSYLHPSYSFNVKEQSIWVPKDPGGTFAAEEQVLLESEGLRADCARCSLDVKGKICLS